MRVTLLAYTQLVDKGLPEDIASWEGSTDATILPEFAFRVCTDTTERMGEDQGFLENWISQGHETPIEHVQFTFLIEDISRVTSHQLVRHRIASFSQESQRYVSEGSGNVIPESIRMGPEHLRTLYFDAVNRTRQVYDELVRGGIRMEDARYVLTGSSLTRMVVSMNLRSLRNFLRLRLDKSAQWEIREVAQHIYMILNEKAPQAVKDLYPLWLKSV